VTRSRLQGLRHYRRRRSLENAMLVRELRRGWFGRLVLWMHARRVKRAMYRQSQLSARGGA
jgi:hypothetical protein